MSEQQTREELTKYARKSVAKGLVVGPGGNISARFEDTMYLSPSGFALEDIEPEQWVPVDIPTGNILDTTYPSFFRGAHAFILLPRESHHEGDRAHASGLLYRINTR